MKLEDTRAEYYFHSGKVSEVVRQLALAGVAVIWIFKSEAGGQQRIPGWLIPAGILILFCLAFDLLQYAVATIQWNRFNRVKEIELGQKKAAGEITDPENEQFAAPAEINDIPMTFFWVKFILVILAYINLIFYLMTRLLG
jgi:hypothetical protein